MTGKAGYSPWANCASEIGAAQSADVAPAVPLTGRLHHLLSTAVCCESLAKMIEGKTFGYQPEKDGMLTCEREHESMEQLLDRLGRILASTESTLARLEVRI